MFLQIATDRDMELDRKKRSEIERRKQAELEAERQGLQQWKESLTAAPQEGDESDYESDTEEQGDKPMPDHPHYHGRGYVASE